MLDIRPRPPPADHHPAGHPPNHRAGHHPLIARTAPNPQVSCPACANQKIVCRKSGATAAASVSMALVALILALFMMF